MDLILFPNTSPLYGGQPIDIKFCASSLLNSNASFSSKFCPSKADRSISDREALDRSHHCSLRDKNFFLVFKGSSLIHFITCDVLSDGSFRSRIPQHNKPESVSVELYETKPKKNPAVIEDFIKNATKISKDMNFDFTDDNISATVDVIIDELYSIDNTQKAIKNLIVNSNKNIDSFSDSKLSFESRLLYFLKFKIDIQCNLGLIIHVNLKSISTEVFEAKKKNLINYLKSYELNETAVLFNNIFILNEKNNLSIDMITPENDYSFLYTTSSLPLAKVCIRKYMCSNISLTIDARNTYLSYEQNMCFIIKLILEMNNFSSKDSAHSSNDIIGNDFSQDELDLSIHNFLSFSRKKNSLKRVNPKLGFSLKEKQTNKVIVDCKSPNYIQHSGNGRSTSCDFNVEEAKRISSTKMSIYFLFSNEHVLLCLSHTIKTEGELEPVNSTIIEKNEITNKNSSFSTNNITINSSLNNSSIPIPPQYRRSVQITNLKNFPLLDKDIDAPYAKNIGINSTSILDHLILNPEPSQSVQTSRENVDVNKFLDKEIIHIKNDTSFKTNSKIVTSSHKKTVSNKVMKFFKRDKSRNLNQNETPKSTDAIDQRASSFGRFKLTNFRKFNTATDIKFTLNQRLEQSMNSFFEQNKFEDPNSNSVLSKVDTWSNLVEAKVLKKMTSKEIKRQDIIYELIYTENQYVRILKTLHQIIFKGLITCVGLDAKTVNKLLPSLPGLLAINGRFLAELTSRQIQDGNFIIYNISDIFNNQFSESIGKCMIDVYTEICTERSDAINLYEELMNSKQEFSYFVKACMTKPQLKKLSIPECLEFMTQRISKYPILIEAILKTHKDDTLEYKEMIKAVENSKNVVKAINLNVAKHENYLKLKRIRKKLDRKMEWCVDTMTYKIDDIFPKDIELVDSQNVMLKSVHRTYDIILIVLWTHIVLMIEKDQKYSLLSFEQPPVLLLQDLLLRVVATDKKAFFLVDKLKANIYEIVCDSALKQLEIINKINSHIKENSETLTTNFVKK